MRPFSGALALLTGLLVAALSAGCEPRCESVCNKLLACGEEGILETDRISQVECEESCDRQSQVFVGWEDEEEFQEAWDEHKSCIAGSECEEIADGECFDERFFLIGG